MSERIVIEVAIDRHGLTHEWHICHPPSTVYGDRAIELDHWRFPPSKSQG